MIKQLPIIIHISVASESHCHNLCSQMSADTKTCDLFGKLTWDKRRKANGNLRPVGCKRAERIFR